MRSRRPRTSLTFIVLGLLLLASVAVGQRIGDNTLFGSTDRRAPAAALLPTPVAAPSGDPSVSRNWKRLQVVSVATDPAFPDPRVTPSPTPSPKPTPSPTASPTAAPRGGYSSPPLPVPLVSHDPGD